MDQFTTLAFACGVGVSVLVADGLQACTDLGTLILEEALFRLVLYYDIGLYMQGRCVGFNTWVHLFRLVLCYGDIGLCMQGRCVGFNIWVHRGRGSGQACFALRRHKFPDPWH